MALRQGEMKSMTSKGDNWQRTTRLCKKYADLEKENDRLGEALQKSLQEIERLKKELAESSEDSAKLKEKNQQLLLLIADLEKNIKDLKEQLASALKSLKESERRNQDLSIELQIKLYKMKKKDRDSQTTELEKSNACMAWLSGRYICHFHFEITKRFKICKRTCESGN